MPEVNPARDAYQASLNEDLANLAAQTPEHVQRIAAEAAEHLLTETQRADNAEERANTDPLTGLLNKAAFREKLDTAVKAAESEGRSFGLLFIDLRNFKKVNDLKGHEEGDDLINRFGQIIGATTRKDSRMREGDVIANEPHYEPSDDDQSGRLGGDEFSILALGVSSKEQLNTIAENIMAAYYSDDYLRESGVGVSLGSALWEPGTTARELLEKADKAMTEHKDTQGPAYRPASSDQAAA